MSSMPPPPALNGSGNRDASASLRYCSDLRSQALPLPPVLAPATPHSSRRSLVRATDRWQLGMLVRHRVPSNCLNQQSVTETANPASLVSLYLLFMSLAV